MNCEYQESILVIRSNSLLNVRTESEQLAMAVNASQLSLPQLDNVKTQLEEVLLHA